MECLGNLMDNYDDKYKGMYDLRTFTGGIFLFPTHIADYMEIWQTILEELNTPEDVAETFIDVYYNNTNMNEAISMEGMWVTRNENNEFSFRLN